MHKINKTREAYCVMHEVCVTSETALALLYEDPSVINKVGVTS